MNYPCQMHSKNQDRVELWSLNKEFVGDLYNFELNYKF